MSMRLLLPPSPLRWGTEEGQSGHFLGLFEGLHLYLLGLLPVPEASHHLHFLPLPGDPAFLLSNYYLLMKQLGEASSPVAGS